MRVEALVDALVVGVADFGVEAVVVGDDEGILHEGIDAACLAGEQGEVVGGVGNQLTVDSGDDGACSICRASERTSNSCRALRID